MNLFQRAKGWLAGSMQASAGVTITYVRGGQSILLTAWVGRTLFAVADNTQGRRVEWGERDYLIRAADLAALGEPMDGDRIVEVIDEGTLTYELMAPAAEPSWRWSDPQRTTYRLHCKRA